MSRIQRRVKSLKNFWSLYKNNRKGVLGLAIVLVFIFLAIFGQWIVPYDPYERNVVERFSPPCKGHILGGDDVGHDIFSQLIYGSRTSLFVGFTAAASTTLIGVFIGIIAGYFKRLDSAIMTFTDIVLVLPSIPIMLTLAIYLGPSIWNIILVMTITSWTGVARVIRSQVLTLKERAYVDSARAIGAGDAHIIIRHILPNVIPIILATAIMRVVSAILSEAGLSFLGLGDPTAISWGMVLHYAQTCGGFSRGAWWWIIPPGLMLGTLAVSFTLIGYSLEEVFSPKLRT
jgi:ABC-type dipeptide/oligopeptide/nickel transport system permease subunit